MIEAKVEMLIRKSVSEVFEAFVDPDITTKFWFTKSSGKVKQNAQLQWDWEMYGVSGQVKVKEFDKNKKLVIEWGEGDIVEWSFDASGEDKTFVTIINHGFKGNEEEIIAKALDSTAGFTIVLCGLKAYLEHNIELNLIADKSPQ